MRIPARHRTALVAAALSTGLILTGCSNGDETTAAAGDGKYTIGFVNGNNTEFHTCLQGAIEKKAEELGVELYTANSTQDAGKELSNIEDMISRGVDAVIVQTVNVDAVEADIAKAKAANVPIYLTSVLLDDMDDVLGASVVPLADVGKMDAQLVEKDAAGKQVEVGVVAGAPGAASDVLVGGFTDNLPGTAKVVANQPGMFSPAKAQEVAENMIQAHPGLDYVFVANEEMAFGALNAFKAAKSSVKIVTNNGTERGVEAVKNGTFLGTVSNPAQTTGANALESAVKLLDKDKSVEKITRTPLTLVTKDTADQAPAYCAE
ncbi:sugar ABC transporter substrate-binding protein [Streptomyces sp. TRM68416]|uniref:sugar ABC transporter substrate-binding protein n=1 Tax=Streptomyces sp. TRM68416 TaxID=2758412 RepID=UPI0016620630|nr:sugar ABC transporter substrate-binding protein [Streptomyces sp. TRM68416]MBD0844017.1 sugar ABC transporter substrate-binding protein [Streptomyces sp. TRM68416]